VQTLPFCSVGNSVPTDKFTDGRWFAARNAEFPGQRVFTVLLVLTVVLYCSIDLGVGVGGAGLGEKNNGRMGPELEDDNEKEEQPATSRSALSRQMLSRGRKRNHLRGAELKVWVYMLTRGGPQSICYPIYDEIMGGTGIETKGTVSKAINRLERIGLIKVFNDKGTRRYLLRDPKFAIARLFDLREITEDEVEDANDLLEKIGLDLITLKPRGNVIKMTPKKTAQGGR